MAGYPKVFAGRGDATSTGMGVPCDSLVTQLFSSVSAQLSTLNTNLTSFMCNQMASSSGASRSSLPDVTARVQSGTGIADTRTVCHPVEPTGGVDVASSLRHSHLDVPTSGGVPPAGAGAGMSVPVVERGGAPPTATMTNVENDGTGRGTAASEPSSDDTGSLPPAAEESDQLPRSWVPIRAG